MNTLSLVGIAEDKRGGRGELLSLAILAATVIWMVWNSFLGVDLVDTGYYYYQYLHPFSEGIPHSAYLATLFGAAWLRLFRGLGLWGLNLFELIIEAITIVVVYRTLRTRFNKSVLISALSFCWLAVGTYVNVFNYHQLSMMFLVFQACAMYVGLSKANVSMLFISGSCGGLATASRMPSVLCLACAVCVLYWHAFVSHTPKRAVRGATMYFLGFFVALAAYALLLCAVGSFGSVWNDIFRLGDLGNSSSGTYGFSSMVKNLVKDSVYGGSAALVFSGGAVIVFLVVGLLDWRKRGLQVREKVGRSVLAAVFACISILALYFGMEKLGNAPNFIQLTSYSWFIYGLFLLFGIAMAAIGIVVEDKKKSEDGCLALIGVALMLLCFVGSAARAKHAILGMWLLAPLMFDSFLSIVRIAANSGEPHGIKINIRAQSAFVSAVIVAGSFLLGFASFVINTNNFDSTDRFELSHEIDSDELRMMKTTERESKSVNGIMEAIEVLASDYNNMMVIGNPVMLYSLTGREAYVRPWVSGTSYTVSELENDISEAEASGKSLPLVVMARTDPYKGFAVEDYWTLFTANKNSFNGSQKGKVLNAFLERNSYEVVYKNDYFALYLPVEGE